MLVTPAQRKLFQQGFGYGPTGTLLADLLDSLFNQITNPLNANLTTQNLLDTSFSVASGYTRIYPNLYVADNLSVDVQDNGELLVP